MNYGIIKNIDNKLVIEYNVFKKRSLDYQAVRVTGPSSKIRVGGLHSYFEPIQIPLVQLGDIIEYKEGEEVEFEIREPNNVIPFEHGVVIPYVPKPHSDRLIGLLVGEIIWLEKLSQYTEDNLIQDIVTPEEKAEYGRLSNVWFEGGSYGKKIDEAIHKQDWENYRGYARSLHIKYLPHEINYADLVGYDITNVEEFARGIEISLWDTDHCCYTFSKDDVKLERNLCLHMNSLKIKFTLDYLKSND